MLTFEYSWLFVLLPTPLLVVWLVPPYRTKTDGLQVPFLDHLARLTGQTPSEGAVVRSRVILQWATLAILWVLLVLAIVKPQWLEPPITRTRPMRDMQLAIDLSGSMETKDFTNASGQKVDRLTAVKEVLKDFLKRRQGDRVGLIVFGNAPFVQAPFTEDLAVCEQLIDEMQPRMAGPKTAFGDAIGLAVTVFDRSTVKEKVLIALTDGNDTGSKVPPAKAAEVAKDKGIVIHTVAVGDPRAAGEEALDEAALKQVAAITGGTYSFAGNRNDLEKVYQQLDTLQTHIQQTDSYRPRRELFQYPLGLALVLSMLFLGGAELWRWRSA